jgi:hypothetical protein
MSWLHDREEKKFFDAQGLCYTIARRGINVIEVKVDTHEEASVVSAHMKALEWYVKDLRRETGKLAEEFDFSKALDWDSFLKEVKKINKQLTDIKEGLKRRLEEMPDDLVVDEKKFSEIFKIDDKNLKKLFEEFFDDFSKLTIITRGVKQGDKQPEIKTEIKLSGDITSETNLPDDKLADYHERMLTVSVNLIKSYIQVIIQIIGILLPIAGITQIGAESFKGITEIIKSFNVTET